MPSIKIRNLTSATEPELVSSNFIAAALDENAGLTKSTRKVTFAQVVIGGLKDGVVPIPIESLPVATNNSLGVVQVGANLSITPQGLLSVDLATLLPSLPIATTNSLGVVQVGANLSITAGGVLSAPAPAAAYQLPTASATILGGVKVGNNLTIDPDGTLNAPAPGGNGGGTTILENSSNSSAADASASTTLALTAGSWRVRADYTYHQSSVGGGSLAIHSTVVHTSVSSPGDTQGTSQDVLFGSVEITANGNVTINIIGTPSNGYPGTGRIMALAHKLA